MASLRHQGRISNSSREGWGHEWLLEEFKDVNSFGLSNKYSSCLNIIFSTLSWCDVILTCILETLILLKIAIFFICCCLYRECDVRCPVDNEAIDERELFADNFAKREILNFKVKCPNSRQGCEVLATLKNVQVGWTVSNRMGACCVGATVGQLIFFQLYLFR